MLNRQNKVSHHSDTNLSRVSFGSRSGLVRTMFGTPLDLVREIEGFSVQIQDIPKASLRQSGNLAAKIE